MDLILWRHAEAEDGAPDLARRLTAKGAKQARRVAEWLQERLPADARILSSPAQRARQTAAALTDDYEVLRELSPASTYQALLTAADWPTAHRTTVIVGHQPTLGQTAAFLLAGAPRDWSIKKGGLWWFTLHHRSNREIVLRAVVSPDQL